LDKSTVNPSLTMEVSPQASCLVVSAWSNHTCLKRQLSELIWFFGGETKNG